MVKQNGGIVRTFSFKFVFQWNDGEFDIGELTTLVLRFDAKIRSGD